MISVSSTRLHVKGCVGTGVVGLLPTWHWWPRRSRL